jgi:RNA polymerase sigma-70 factor (ECF subfamily)
VALESELGGEIAAARERIDPALDPAAAAARAEAVEGVHRLLGRLPAEQREVLALKVLGGLTLSETAAAIGCPLETVKSRLRYGLEKVHRMLENPERIRP